MSEATMTHSTAGASGAQTIVPLEAPVRVSPVAPSTLTEERHARHERHEQASLATRLSNIAGVVIPLLGVIAAMILLWGVAFNWIYLAIMVVMYLATGLGITVGFHRYFTHKSFDAPKPVIATLGVLGSMAVQGPIIHWAAAHRKHHQHSDEEEDPHSPNTSGAGILGTIRGMWHAHVGWLFEKKRHTMARYVPDLRKDPLTRTISRLFPVWVLVGLIVPGIIAGLLTMSWMGVLLGVLWGGFVRVFLVHHVTWSVNSVCHIWGARPFESHDHSRNNPIVGVLAMGEGWHNNHHAFPTSARHGLSWWQFDLSYIVIRTLELLGLASNVKIPAPERIEAKRRR